MNRVSAVARRQAARTDSSSDEHGGARGLSRERRAGVTEPVAPPAVGQTDDDDTGAAHGRDERIGIRIDEHGLGRHPERTLHRDRGVSEQSARVPSVRARRRAHETQARASTAGEPGAELDGRPVVLGTGEGHDDGARAGRAADHDAHVARCLIEQRQHPGVLEQAVGCVHEQQVDVVLACEPGHVDAGSDRREHGRARLDPLCDQSLHAAR